MKRDYNILAQAVHCPSCGSQKGEFCLGSRGVHVKFTHYTRRNLATKARGDLVRASRNESRRTGA